MITQEEIQNLEEKFKAAALPFECIFEVRDYQTKYGYAIYDGAARVDKEENNSMLLRHLKDNKILDDVLNRISELVCRMKKAA